MKILVYLIFFLPSIAFGQTESPYQFLKFENEEVLFDKIYTADSLTLPQVENLLATRLPGVKNIISLTKSEDQFSGQLDKCYIDAAKYGGKTMTTLMVLGYPLTASVNAYWKEGRYRIVINRIQWITTLTLMGTSASGTLSATEVFHPRKEWKSAKSVVSGGGYVEQYFSDLFNFMKPVKNDW